MTQPSSLTLTTRDIQYLVAAHAVARAAIGTVAGYASDSFLEANVEALVHLHADDHFSAQESNALMDRLRALLPLDGPVVVMDGFPLQSSNTLVQ